MDEKKTETLTVEQQKRLNMTGVVSVDGFSERAVHATLGAGRMLISGENLKVLAFSKTTGNLSVDGRIDSVKFSGGKQPLVKRLFK